MTAQTPVKPEYKDLDLEGLKALMKEIVQEEFVEQKSSGGFLRVTDNGEGDELDTHIGTPTESQFKAIQQLTNSETSAEDWMVVPFTASNNLVDLGYRRWHQNVLRQMAQGFVGRPHILDHDWYDSESAVSFIFDVKLINDSGTDSKTVEMGGFGDYNKEIIENEGYTWVYMCAAIAKTHDAAEAIRTRRYNDCSTGSILNQPRMICPNCTRDKGREVDFYETDKNGDYVCPHLIPSRFMFWLFGDDPDVEFADYAILDAVHHEAVELSSCTRGALPAASVCRD
ncbi:hypothetical protein Lepto7375DRAFT_7287 [Leptolyngbya sp. PCC 7375]|nr:hypothetical protein Lepto7375DRAFT_7287 [Leptolyngbya sp. PCC 7375]